MTRPGPPPGELFRRFDGYEDLKALLEGSDEDVLVALARPTLVRIPGTDARPRARLLSCLLHGNEDSGYRAVLGILREGAHYPFDLWVFIGNVRAAHQDGWFAHRFLEGQEDFNRVWGLNAPTTRMRRCADEVLDVLVRARLEAAVDLHNNTGQNPWYAVVPRPNRESLHVAATCVETGLLWGLNAHTLMEALAPHCPAIAIECGLPGIPANAEFAAAAARRFLDAPPLERGDRIPERLFEILHRVIVRPEVPFAFGGRVTDEIDLVLKPGLDGANFGMLLAGTGIGQVAPGAAMPLCATDMRGHDVTERYFSLTPDGDLMVNEDITPLMMTTTVLQARRDCLFYIGRRRH